MNIRPSMFTVVMAFLSHTYAMQVSVEPVTSANLAAEEAVFRNAFIASYGQSPIILEQISKKYPTLDTFLYASFEDENVDFSAHKPNAYFIHAKIGDTVVGYMSFDIRADNTAYIRQLAIDPACAKRGIGRMLLSFVFKSNPTITKISGCTRRANTRAIDFYKHLGCKITECTHEGFDPAIYIGIEYTPN